MSPDPSREPSVSSGVRPCSMSSFGRAAEKKTCETGTYCKSYFHFSNISITYMLLQQSSSHDYRPLKPTPVPKLCCCKQQLYLLSIYESRFVTIRISKSPLLLFLSGSLNEKWPFCVTRAKIYDGQFLNSTHLVVLAFMKCPRIHVFFIVTYTNLYNIAFS